LSLGVVDQVSPPTQQDKIAVLNNLILRLWIPDGKNRDFEQNHKM